jgi:hypothetical protein
MSLPAVRRFVRLRSADELGALTRAAPGAVVVNANLLEHRAARVSDWLADRGIPFLVDPVLWKFQVPSWWQREDGGLRRNFARLARSYGGAGTRLGVGLAPIMQIAPSDDEWRRLARNVIRYQRDRIRAEAGDLALLMGYSRTPAEPIADIAPYVLAYDREHDRVNGLLLTTAAEEAAGPLVGCLALPRNRAVETSELESALGVIVDARPAGCLVWFEGMTEELMLDDESTLNAFLHAVDRLGRAGVAVWHAHGGYSAFALRSRGLTGFVHPLAWKDNGMPAQQPSAVVVRSCTTYATGFRGSVHFQRAMSWGGGLSGRDFLRLYCDCHFCSSTIDAGGHPFEHLLEVTTVGATRRETPTSLSVAANELHFLFSRADEERSFEGDTVAAVLARARERAHQLTGDEGRLARLTAAV